MNGRSCARFVAVYNGHPSETRNTIKYAKKKGVPVISCS